METVIVIGAGASHDFCKVVRKEDRQEYIKAGVSMPTGEELIRQMMDFESDLLLYGRKGYLRQMAEELTPSSSDNGKFVQEIVDKDLIALRGAVSIRVALSKHGLIQEGWSWCDGQQRPTIHACGERWKHPIIEELWGPDSERHKFFVEKIAIKLGFKNHLRLAALLKHYHPESIDNFLTSIKYKLVDVEIDLGDGEVDRKYTNDDLVNAGKELIVYWLLKAENAKIFNAEHKIWYRWLREAIINSYANKSFAEFEESDEKKRSEKAKEIIKENINKIQIINFNYDRSLEYYLDKQMPDFAEEIKNKIFHPYGGLKNCGYQYGGLKADLRNPSIGISDIFQKIKDVAEKEIKIIGEERNSDKDFFERLRKDSRKLYFLGFGFIEDNLSRFLGEDCFNITYDINDAKSDYVSHKVFYTNYENAQKVEQKVQNYFRPCVKAPPSSIRLGMGSMINPMTLTDIESLNVNVDKIERDKIRDKIFTKSSKGVYDALNEDFALII